MTRRTMVGSAPDPRQVDTFIEIGRRLDRKGMIAANDGNLSCLDADGSILVTATGSRKGYLQPADVIRIDAGGRRIFGEREPSSEVEMHLAAYRERTDIRAVVHAHPPVATGFAAARQALGDCVLPEIVLTLGQVPLAPYATPGTPELAESIRTLIRDHDAVLLSNHGVIAVGPSLDDAYFTLERVEHSARILLYARLLGGETRLQHDEVRRLLATDPQQSDVAGLPCRVGDSAPVDTRRPSGDDDGSISPAAIAEAIAAVLRERNSGSSS